MDEPIISPWLIYFIEILPSMEASIAFFILLYTAWLVGLAFHRIELPSFREVLLIVVGTILIVLIPSKETMYQMLIAYNITPEFLLKSGETAEVVTKTALDLITNSVVKVVEAIKK